MALIPLGILSAAGAGGAAFSSDFELIETAIVSGSSTTGITFSNLGTYSSTYKHLQVRYVARAGNSIDNGIYMRLNGDSGSNYAQHVLLGLGSSVISAASTSQVQSSPGLIANSDNSANIFAAGVIDLLDPYSTTKNKTTRAINGIMGTAQTRVALSSTLSVNTASVTSWSLFPSGNEFAAGTRISLYGVKG